MSVPYTTPPPLAPGARVALLSPAGPLASPADLERADGNVRDMGWEPHSYPSALARDGYLAGDDSARLADLNAAIRDPVSYTHLRAHETGRNLVCRLLLEK